jgi:hypothetical protein
MENDNGRDKNGEVMQALQQVQRILERNRMIIQEISDNYEDREAGSLSRNIALIRELNSNTACIMQLNSGLSSSFSLSPDKGSPTAADAAKGDDEILYPP